MICNPHISHPPAIARIHGGNEFPTISGTVSFFPVREGIIISANIHGLPAKDTGGDFFAFHIHEGSNCTGSDFSDTGAHFDLHSALHPHHTGDLPPLFASHGRAYLEFWTDRFRISDVLGRTIIIHENTDDLHTQPSGNAGKRIACGKILRNCCR